VNFAFAKGKFCARSRVLQVRRQLVEGDVGLAHQRRLRVVLGRDLLPASVDLVHLGTLAQVLLSVPELLVLDQPVRDVDAHSAHAAVEPEAEDAVELVPDVLVPPVEVGPARAWNWWR